MGDETTITATPATFDFGAVGDTNNHEWNPRDPRTDEPVTSAVFHVAGEDTPHYRRMVSAATQAQAKRIQRGKVAASFDEFGMDVAVGVLLDWSNVSFNGRELPCTDANKRMLFTERRWLYDQFREFLNAREQRLGKS